MVGVCFYRAASVKVQMNQVACLCILAYSIFVVLVFSKMRQIGLILALTISTLIAGSLSTGGQ